MQLHVDVQLHTYDQLHTYSTSIHLLLCNYIIASYTV
jgi:hypothetical protein